MLSNKKLQILSIVGFLGLWLFGGCKATKSAEGKTGSAIETKTAAKPEDGIYTPGMAELAAIQRRNPNVTAEHLQEGFVLYSRGACVQCHQPFNVYQFSESSWKHIIDEMAIKAQISNQEKAAIFAFVLSIKDSKSNH